ncbi:MAG: Fic family protein [Alphaproteobacteria bacterium]|jgi:Fic family protein|nr:Fic family protein [Alphaproteobacteria bacterium]
MDYDKLTEKYLKIKPYLNDKELFYYKFVEDFDIENTYHSNAIEGNTLTLMETSLVLEGCSIGSKDMRELFEVVNHSKAFNYIFETKDNNKPIIDIEDILKIHSMILNNIDDYNKGVYRRVNVGIRGTNIIFPFPNDLPKLMAEFNNWFVEKQKIGIMHPVELASKAHFELVNIHPFIDGNGRTSRLLMNMVLLKNKYPPIMIKVEEKLEYINALNETRDNKTNAFDKFIYKKMDERLDSLLELSKDFEVEKDISEKPKSKKKSQDRER